MFVLLITELGNDIMQQAYRQHEKLEFGGESPQTMRHGRWVINQHPLGPSTRKRFEIAICSNPYATVGAAIVPPEGF